MLTLWATVVAERLGYPPEAALTLGRFVAGSSARAKARRLGISDEKRDAEERHAWAAALQPRRQTVHLLGRDIPVMAADDGTLRVEDDGKPASAKSVQSYIARAFGDRLAEARTAMEALAASLQPEELNRVGFRLYERFRPALFEQRRRASLAIPSLRRVTTSDRYQCQPLPVLPRHRCICAHDATSLGRAMIPRKQSTASGREAGNLFPAHFGAAKILQ